MKVGAIARNKKLSPRARTCETNLGRERSDVSDDRADVALARERRHDAGPPENVATTERVPRCSQLELAILPLHREAHRAVCAAFSVHFTPRRA